MKKTVYQVAEQKFKEVSAYAIMKGDTHICNISIKYPRDGMGRLHGFMHSFGLEMVYDYVGGYGYDKRTAVICRLVKKQLDAIISIKNDENREFVKQKYSDYIDLCNHIIENGECGWDIGIYSKFEIIRVI